MATTRTARKPRAAQNKKKSASTKKPADKPADKPPVDTNVPAKVTVSSLIKAAKGLDKAATSLWGTTGLLIFQRLDKFKAGINRDNMRETFLEILQAEHKKGDVPKHGMSQDGKVIELHHEDGTIKWRTWKVTGRLVQNTTEVFKAIEAGLEIWNGEGEIISRRKILEMLKDLEPEPEEVEGEEEEEGEKEPEEAIATIQRSVTLIDQKFGELNKDDLELAFILLETLLEDLQNRF